MFSFLFYSTWKNYSLLTRAFDERPYFLGLGAPKRTKIDSPRKQNSQEGNQANPGPLLATRRDETSAAGREGGGGARVLVDRCAIMGGGGPLSFLNGKSWHTGNKAARERLERAEAKAAEDEKRRKARALELERESDKLRQASLLHTGTRARAMAEGKVALSFMYSRPAGLDEAEKKVAFDRERRRQEDAAKTQEREDPRQKQQRRADSGNPNPVPIWLKRGDDDQDRAVEAPPSLKKVADSKFELRHEYGGDRSPIRGGGSAGDENQQILVEDSGEEDVGEEDGGRRRRHGRHRHRREDGGRRRKRRRHRREDR